MEWGSETNPSDTSCSFPSGAIALNKMLQPTQPARRAEGASGFRRSIADALKKNDGMISRFITVQPEVYCSESRLGTASLLMAAIMAEYPASGIRFSFHFRPLLSWYTAPHRWHPKSTAR